MELNQITEAHQIIKSVANKTPVLTSRTLNRKTELEVYFKGENFQRGGAFKFRGAYNAISQLTDEQKESGVITHSSGNHAQAVALAGSLLGIKTTIVMPENAPQVKVNATRGYGAKIEFCKSTIEAREATCNRLITEKGYTLIHPYDNDDVIAGAATAAKELVDEIGSLDAIFAPIGGGGLISGTALYAKKSNKIELVFGIEPAKADDAYRSYHSGTLQSQNTPDTIADGLRTTLSPRTFRYISKYVDEIFLVEEEEIIEAMKFLWQRMKIIVEPSGAVPLASILKGIDLVDFKDIKKIGIILSGGNIDLGNFFDDLI